MITLQKLFQIIESDNIASPCTDSSKIDRLEGMCGYKLPSDLKAFYRRYDSVSLFVHEFGATYRIVPVEEIRPTWLDIFGAESDERGPENWLTICDVLDGSYVAIEVFPYSSQTNNLIDCFHETFAMAGQSQIVAKTFTEFLDRAIASDSGVPYFVKAGFQSYGDALASH